MFVFHCFDSFRSLYFSLTVINIISPPYFSLSSREFFPALRPANGSHQSSFQNFPFLQAQQSHRVPRTTFIYDQMTFPFKIEYFLLAIWCLDKTPNSSPLSSFLFLTLFLESFPLCSLFLIIFYNNFNMSFFFLCPFFRNYPFFNQKHTTPTKPCHFLSRYWGTLTFIVLTDLPLNLVFRVQHTCTVPQVPASLEFLLTSNKVSPNL